MTINILSEITLFISYIKMFSSSNLYSFVLLFPKKRLMFPFSLVPQTPGKPSGFGVPKPSARPLSIVQARPGKNGRL